MGSATKKTGGRPRGRPPGSTTTKNTTTTAATATAKSKRPSIALSSDDEDDDLAADDDQDEDDDADAAGDESDLASNALELTSRRRSSPSSATATKTTSGKGKSKGSGGGGRGGGGGGGKGPKQAIPADLLRTLVQHHFRDRDMRVNAEAGLLVGKYMETFVREAIARAVYERAEARGKNREESGKGNSSSKGSADDFLEVEDLEKLAPQLLLDF